MSFRKKDDSPLARYAHSRPFGLSNKSSWFGSSMDNVDVTRLDISRNSTRLVDVSEPPPAPEIGVRYKQQVDGTSKEVYNSFRMDDTNDGSGPLLFKNFLQAVQKHTMGETGTSSEIFESRNNVVRLNEFGPAPKPLKSDIGPFKGEPALLMTGKSDASAYCNLSLKCIYEYIDNGSIFKPLHNFCLLHGGLPLDANGKAIFERCIPNAMDKIMRGEEVKATDVSDFAKFNDIHQLGFGGSVITGRLAVQEACTGSKKALEAMHPLVRTTVVGHTPQWLGIPTIIREETATADKFLVALDTQFSNRQKNTHSLGMFKDGSFCLVGKWMDVFEYEARSDDIHIGQKMKIDTDEMETHGQSTSHFRVIARVKGQVADVYIAVNYALNPANLFAPAGFTTVCLVGFSKRSETGLFKAEIMRPDPYMVRVTGKTFLNYGSIEISDYHATAPAKNTDMESSNIGSTINTFVCGDIEASVDFLHAFIMHSHEMATKDTLVPTYLEAMNSSWENGTLDLAKYGLPNPDNSSLGFHTTSISDKMKQIMYVSQRICTHGILPPSFSCIGDLMGDPVGKGNLDNVGGTEQIHEFICVHWANTFCEHKVIGNRDINKLRFLQEIPYIAKQEHLEYLQNISEYQQEFANGIPTNTGTLKRLLGHFCYPYVPSEKLKDAQGNAVNVNKSFARDAAIVPFRTTTEDSTLYPPTIWEAQA